MSWEYGERKGEISYSMQRHRRLTDYLNSIEKKLIELGYDKSDFPEYNSWYNADRWRKITMQQRALTPQSTPSLPCVVTCTHCCPSV